MERINHQEAVSSLPYSVRFFVFLLRKLSRLLYHQFAWSYDGVSWIVSVGNWQKWVRSVLPFINGPRVLEIGFGPGHLQFAMAQKGIKCFGLDESLQMVQLAQKRLNKHGFQPVLLRGEAANLPFANESIDQVVMTFPADFIFQPATLSGIKRILAHSGVALVLPLAWITGRKPWEKLAAWLNQIMGEAPVWNPDVLEPLKAAGFEVNWEMIDLSNSKIVLIRLYKP